MQASEAARQRGDHRLGARLAQQAADDATARGDDKLLASALTLLARHLFCLGDVEGSMRAAQLALQQVTAAGDLSAQSALHGLLALNFERAELGTQALTHAVASLDTARAAGDRQAESMALQRVGMASETLDDIDRGLSFVRQGLDLARQVGSDEAVFSALNNLACRGLGKADRLAEQQQDSTDTLTAALADARAALAHAQRGGNAYQVALVQSNLAPILRRLGLLDEARQTYQACAALCDQMGYRNLRAAVDLGLGLLACDDPQRSDGPQQLEAVLPTLALNAETGPLLRARRKLYQVYKAQGRLAEALAQHEELHALELRSREVRADLQSRLLINRVDVDQARHAAERARLESEVQRLRAEDKERVAHRLARDRGVLERLVDLRTAELQAAKEAAEDASRAKTAFLAVMSHELRTPLNGLLGMTELALRRATDPRQIGQLTQGVAAGWHLRDLINDILDISAIENRALPLHERPFELHTLLNEAVQSLQAAAAAKGLHLAVRVEPGLPLRWQGDPLRVKQILLNYLGNAVKFSHRGEVCLQVSRSPGERAVAGLRFEVTDQGPGIDPAVKARLFQPFTPGDDSSTRRHGGLGLGLAITSRLAQLMGGDVGVRSQPGQGSTFWATVRLAPIDEPRAPPAAMPADESALAPLRRRHAGTRVLLAEDMPVNREVVVAMLEEADLVVEVAVDGAHCVQLASQRRHALILMDLQMPGLDGLEAARRIRQLPGMASVPIVALTARAYEEDRLQSLAAGMQDHLTKPVDMGRLHAAVLKALDSRRG